MFVFLVVFSCGLVLQSSCADVVEGEPEILNNGTSLDTQDGDIAHITCIVRGKPRPLVRWEKKGLVIKDKDEGMAILSTSNSSVDESHLFVAVTSGGRRGEYTCVVTNKKGVSKQSFLITEKSRKLSTLDIAAILISVGITLFFVIAIGFLLWRARKKVKGSEKRQRARTISQSSAQENNALVGDSIDSPEDEETRNGIRKSSHCVTAV